MTAHASEKIDPAHWMAIAGGAVMMAVVCLCSVALMLPWWTYHRDEPGKKSLVEVTLWIRYSRADLAADDSTLNCETQCDFTKLGSAQVREKKVAWGDACSEGGDAEDMGNSCQQLWVVRINVLICWFLSLLFTVFSMLNFCGAGLPASTRVPATAKIVLAVCCLASCGLALGIATVMEVGVVESEPGTEPKETEPKPLMVSVNGIGFLCILVAAVLSIIGIGFAYLSQVVITHLNQIANVEQQGRPLADVNRAKPPSVDHQVGHTPGYHDPEIPKKALPEPKPFGSWMA